MESCENSRLGSVGWPAGAISLTATLNLGELESSGPAREVPEYGVTCSWKSGVRQPGVCCAVLPHRPPRPVLSNPSCDGRETAAFAG